MRKRVSSVILVSLSVSLLFSATLEVSSAEESPSDKAFSVSRNPWVSPAAADERSGEVSDSIKRIALTFDDGPHYLYTEPILDLLKEYGVSATFFVVGNNVSRFPEIVQREIAEGHEVGNHTNTHPSELAKLDKTNQKKELVDAENAIYEVADYRPHLFRPPGGSQSETLTEITYEMDYSLVMWSIDTRDWNRKTTVDKFLETVRENVRDGSIILCHDFVSRSESITLEALKILIPELLSEGYQFVLVSDIIE